jgi:D-alanyl-D-alanine carboxypeptidase
MRPTVATRKYAGAMRLFIAAWIAAAATPTTVAPPAFTAAISPVKWADLRYSYRAGCPVGPAELRTLRLSYWGFDGRPRVGRLVVHRRVSRDVVAVFRRLYAARFPIRRMVPVSRYRGSDDASMAADNTSAFNCRFVSGTSRWSMHAFGLAIDVNPVENPYISGGRASPPAGRRYLDRDRARQGMAVTGGALVNAFAAVGWRWGGLWSGAADYQHFSTNGR